MVGCNAYCQLDKVEQQGKNDAKAWMGPLVGYSIDTLGYRVWDLVSHKVWDVKILDFDEMVSGGWWKKLAAHKKTVWEEEAPLDLVGGLDPVEKLPGEKNPPPPADGDADGESDSLDDGGPLADVDADDPPEPEGV